MRYLLDTHTLIWYYDNFTKIPVSIIEEINNDKNQVFISSVSLWEIVIKININKLKLNFGINDLLANIDNKDFDIIQIEDAYLKIYLNLPLIHRDPFDRLIISTAIAEGLTILTHDKNIHKYNVNCLWY
jgi:PIN domain nuclease of toxin-antitoxin system